MEQRLLGACNYFCENCAILKKGKCLGCHNMNEKARTEGRVFCDIYPCAHDKQLSTCSDCPSYPCEKYDDSIFAPSFIKFLRDKLKVGK